MLNFENKVKKAALLIALSLTATLPQSFAAGDGRGISGPDLSGSALPIEVDRQVTEAEAHEVVSKCGTEFAKTLLAQIYSSPAPKDYFLKGNVRPSFEDEDETQVIDDVMTGYYFRNPHSPFEFGSEYIQYFKLQVTYQFTELWVLPQSSAPRTTDEANIYRHVVGLIAPKIGIPTLKYKTFNSDFVYDDLGSEVSHKTYLKNLTLKNFNQKPIRFRNKKTGVETGVTLDLRPYAECLLDGIQSGEFANR